MKRKTILPLSTPLLSTWSSESHFMAMILTEKKASEWIFNNYINVLGRFNPATDFYSVIFSPDPNPENGLIPFNAWSCCPFLDTFHISHNTIKNNYSNILEYLCYAIDNGFYVYFTISQNELSTRLNVDLHKLFIYGYDTEKELLYVADHYNNGKYSTATISFTEYLNAYIATYINNNFYDLINTDKNEVYEKHQITIAKPHPFDYDFNIDWFKLQLKDYLNSKYSLSFISPVNPITDEEYYFGISCYNLIFNYLDKLTDKSKKHHKDPRLFTMLVDHKKLLKLRIDYFINKGIVALSPSDIREYNTLVHNSQNLLYVFLKFKVSGNIELLYKIQQQLSELKCKEEYILKILLDKLP